MPGRPGGSTARRPLHFFWLLDCSASMAFNGKIDALNNAVRVTLPALEQEAAANPFSQLLIRALTFSQGVRWQIPQPTPIEQVQWTDLQPFGHTDMGHALGELAAHLTSDSIPSRAFPPAIVLVSDGQPTDDFEGGLAKLMATPWGAKAVRVAIAIGGDADVGVLNRFVGDPEMPALTAGNPDELVHYLRWVSTAATRMASTPVGEARIAVPSAPGIDQAANAVTW